MDDEPGSAGHLPATLSDFVRIGRLDSDGLSPGGGAAGPVAGNPPLVRGAVELQQPETVLVLLCKSPTATGTTSAVGNGVPESVPKAERAFDLGVHWWG